MKLRESSFLGVYLLLVGFLALFAPFVHNILSGTTGLILVGGAFMAATAYVFTAVFVKRRNLLWALIVVLGSGAFVFGQRQAIGGPIGPHLCSQLVGL